MKQNLVYFKLEKIRYLIISTWHLDCSVLYDTGYLISFVGITQGCPRCHIIFSLLPRDLQFEKTLEKKQTKNHFFFAILLLFAAMLIAICCVWYIVT